MFLQRIDAANSRAALSCSLCIFSILPFGRIPPRETNYPFAKLYFKVGWPRGSNFEITDEDADELAALAMTDDSALRFKIPRIPLRKERASRAQEYCTLNS